MLQQWFVFVPSRTSQNLHEICLWERVSFEATNINFFKNTVFSFLKKASSYYKCLYMFVYTMSNLIGTLLAPYPLKKLHGQPKRYDAQDWQRCTWWSPWSGNKSSHEIHPIEGDGICGANWLSICFSTQFKWKPFMHLSKLLFLRKNQMIARLLRSSKRLNQRASGTRKPR